MSDRLVPAGVKLAVRGDRKAGVIRAYLSTDDDSDRYEVATLNIAVADLHRDLFEAWVELMTRVVNTMVEATTGATVAGNQRITLADKN